MYVLNYNGIKNIRAVTNESNNILEIKNIVTVPKCKNQGYDKKMIKFVEDKHRNEFKNLQVGTGNSPSVISFYEKSGFRKSYKIKNLFVDNYEKPIGIRLTDILRA